MKIVFRPLIMLSLAFGFAGCVEMPENPFIPNDSFPTESRWYVIDSANDRLNFVDLTNFSVRTNALPSANSTIIADAVIPQGTKYAYVAGGYFGGGSSDLRKIDLGDGMVAATAGFGAGQTLTAGALDTENGFIYAAHYASSDGRLKKYNASLGIVKNVFLGGMPQALCVRNDAVYIANIDSYSCLTNWIDVVPAGSSTAVRFVLPAAANNPVALAVSDDGTMLFVQCAGNNGSICVITNADTSLRGVKTNIPLNLGFNAYGKIRNLNGRVFYSTGVGLYELDPASFTVTLVALASTGCDDIDSDGIFLYVSSDWSANAGYVLRISDFSVYQTVAVPYGTGALYLQ